MAAAAVVHSHHAVHHQQQHLQLSHESASTNNSASRSHTSCAVSHSHAHTHAATLSSRAHDMDNSSAASSCSSSSSSRPRLPTRSRIQRGRMLRKITGGAIYSGTYLPSQRSCIIKRIDEGVTQHAWLANMIKNEVGIHHNYLSQLPNLSPRIIRMDSYHYDAESDSVSMIIERGEEGDLMTHVQNVAQNAPREPTARKYFTQLVEGLKFLHVHHVAHLDIKLENLVLDRHMDLKIIDFGMSLRVPDAEHDEKAGGPLYTKRVGTPQWMPPEVFDHEECARGYNPYRSDIWSCGVVLFTLLFGFPLFELPCGNDLCFRHVQSGRIRLLLKKWKLLDTVSPAAIDLLESLLVPSHQRPSLDQILQSEFVTQRLDTDNNNATHTHTRAPHRSSQLESMREH